MKKFRSIALAGAFALTVAGCGGSNMMMQEMQNQLNAAEAAAEHAKEMASDALMKSSRMEKHMAKKHDYKMMK